MPMMPNSFVEEVSERYIELSEKVTGQPFRRADTSRIEERIYENVMKAL